MNSSRSRWPGGYGFGASIVVSGLVLVPLSVCSFLASRLLTVYERRFGAQDHGPPRLRGVRASRGVLRAEHRRSGRRSSPSGLPDSAIGFTTGAMPGFIVRAVAQTETGSATGFFQVVRSIGLTLGSALSAAVLMANTSPGASLPDVEGFRVALIIAAGLCLVTVVVSYVLPGSGADRLTTG